MSCVVSTLKTLGELLFPGMLGRDQPVTGRDQKKRPHFAQKGNGRDQPVTTRDHHRPHDCKEIVNVFYHEALFGLCSYKWLLKS